MLTVLSNRTDAGTLGRVTLAVAILALTAPPGEPAAAPPLGRGAVVLDGARHELEQVFHWVPYSFADRTGLRQLLATGRDPAPVAGEASLSFTRRRSYPIVGWSSGTPRVVAAVTVRNDEKNVTRGRLVVRVGRVTCTADVSGRCSGTGSLEGRCRESGRPVRLEVNAWRTGTPFQFSDANRGLLGAALPDWPKLHRLCTEAQETGPPYCGQAALERLAAQGGRQEDEPLGGTWIPARGGRMLVHLAWLDGEEILLLERIPGNGLSRGVPAESLFFDGGVEAATLSRRARSAVDIEGDGFVYWLHRGGRRARRIVPDQLVVTGVWADALTDVPER